MGIVSAAEWDIRKKSLPDELPDRELRDVLYAPKSCATFFSMLRMGRW